MRRGGVAVLTVACLVALPAGASGAITIGSTAGVAGIPATNGLTHWQRSATVPYAVPAGFGVVTSWSARFQDAGLLSLKIMRPTGPGQQVTVMANAPGIAPGPGVFAFTTAIPVQPGDVIGVGDPPADGIPLAMWAFTTDSGDQLAGVVGDRSVGDTFTPGNVINGQLSLSATIERDVDGDAFGDETQDLCPGVFGHHSGCVTLPGPPAVVPPDTKITKKPKKTLRKRKAKVKFTSPTPSATFECKLDTADFAPCTSPAKLKRLKLGKHAFEVRAINQGVADPTPAAAKFKRKPAKK